MRTEKRYNQETNTLTLPRKQTMSPYKIAIDQTTQTMNQRLKNFRYLVVMIICAGLGSVIWAGVSWSASPLAGLLLVVALCGLCLLFDFKLLKKWRQDLLEAWIGGELDFKAFCEAINTIPTLPKDSVQSMLDSLPLAKDLVSEQGISSSTRTAIAAVVTSVYQDRYYHTALLVVVWALIIGVTLGTVIAGTWSMLLWGLCIVPFFLLLKWMKLRQLRRVDNKIQIAGKSPDFDFEQFTELTTDLGMADRVARRILCQKEILSS